MITKVDIDNDAVVGRLGNKMFQIAAGYSMAKEIGCDFMIPAWKYAHVFPNVKMGTVTKFNNIYTEPSFTYSRPPVDYFHGVVQLNGYFQSEKYFRSKEEIQELLKFSEYTRSMAQVWATHNKVNLKDFTALHIRRGDYTNLTHYYADLPSTDYYRKAIKESCNKKFLVFSDDIDFCIQYFSEFQDCHFEYVSGNSDHVDMCLMSMCKNNIIANSSFSWWGAYLNKDSDKTIAPKNWFVCGIDSKDLYAKDWTVI